MIRMCDKLKWNKYFTIRNTLRSNRTETCYKTMFFRPHDMKRSDVKHRRLENQRKKAVVTTRNWIDKMTIIIINAHHEHNLLCIFVWWCCCFCWLSLAIWSFRCLVWLLFLVISCWSCIYCCCLTPLHFNFIQMLCSRFLSCVFIISTLELGLITATRRRIPKNEPTKNSQECTKITSAREFEKHQKATT